MAIGTPKGLTGRSMSARVDQLRRSIESSPSFRSDPVRGACELQPRDSVAASGPARTIERPDGSGCVKEPRLLRVFRTSRPSALPPRARTSSVYRPPTPTHAAGTRSAHGGGVPFPPRRGNARAPANSGSAPFRGSRRTPGRSRKMAARRPAGNGVPRPLPAPELPAMPSRHGCRGLRPRGFRCRER
jgi:hypothetical protein